MYEVRNAWLQHLLVEKIKELLAENKTPEEISNFMKVPLVLVKGMIKNHIRNDDV